jgi:DNA-binding CsgD family transcriptional regulator
MSEYLSKEEIKRWRSSLEKITLEEYAARLGKKIEETKSTRDLVDIVLQGKPVASSTQEWAHSRAERLSTIAQRSFEREKEITITPFSPGQDAAKIAKSVIADKLKAEKAAVKEKAAKAPAADALREEVRIVFKKALTEREQRVFDYLVQNNNKIVYAKDLAQLLDLPRDYVYKYIKNLRTKIDGDNLQNADKGGFVLSF